jgi:monoamine oxidase
MTARRTPIGRILQDGYRVHDAARRSGRPVDEVLEDHVEQRISRRRLLRVGAGGAIAAAGLAFRPGLAGAASSVRTDRLGGAGGASSSRVVIVGAGLAGLRCADKLFRNGVRATIYEAATDHVGGRCWTNRGYFSGDLIAEHGGEFISSEHTAVRRLAARFELELEDVNGGALRGHDVGDIFWMDGAPYTVREAVADWNGPAHHAFHAAAHAAPWPQTYARHSPEGRRLDQRSVDEFVEHAVPGGASSRLGRLLRENAISEYGGDPSNQSSLNLIAIVGYLPRDEIEPLAGTDERFHVRGGNDLLVDGLVRSLPDGAIRTGEELIAVRRLSSGAYRCTFRRDGTSHDVHADHLVLALPFTALRRVDLARAGLSALKQRAIQQLDLGTHAKLVLELSGRTWGPSAPATETRSRDGIAYSGPAGFGVTWDGSVGHGPRALLVDFLGAGPGARLGTEAHGPAPAADVNRFLDQAEPLFPGTRAAFTGRAWNDTWARDPWHHGAYSYWQVGQTTGFGGYEGVQETGIHFCGEHTSVHFQGYLEGAVRSGTRAADEVLAQA